MEKSFEAALRPRVARAGRWRRIVAPLVGVVAAAGLAACEPPPAPDGRDLGVELDSPPPVRVDEGTEVVLTGAVTNHGTAPAGDVTVVYAVTGGFTVDLDLGSAATCTPVSPTQVGCTITDALAPGASLPFTAHATAGEVSGAHTHLLGTGSDGTEPKPDTNPGYTVFTTTVESLAAAPEPVGIGGGTNYLGTGRLLEAAGAGRPNENMHLAVNPYCTAKVNGDRYQSGIDPPNITQTCAAPANTEYRADGYTYAIDVPAGRPSTLDVLLWDARYNWSGTGAVDLRLNGQGFEPFTYSLHSADDTPLDHSDNPLLCTQTFHPDTPFDQGAYLGSERWNRLCSIPTSAPAGRYLLRVRNGGMVTNPVADGSNQFGIVATYASDGSGAATSLCDRVTRPNCPVVSGAGEASIQIVSDASVARIPVGPVEAHQDGRTLRIELFDPGEGMDRIRILAPTGTTSWSPVEFRWSSPGVSGSGGTVTSLRVMDGSNSRFNGRVVTIEVDLADYVPPAGNEQWLVEYVAVSGVPVTDRTTWNAAIVDQP